jgi:hypothetical protein
MDAFAKTRAANQTYTYSINLDERGSFYATVDSPTGKTVFQIRAGNELPEDETSIFDDGYMRDKNDTAGLTDYLRELGIIGKQSRVVHA